MENQCVTFEKFTWTIKNFSKLVSKKHSETFVIGGHPWRILTFPTGNNVDYLSIYLDAVGPANYPKGWSRFAHFRLALLNQVNSDLTITKETQHHFNARESDWGFTSFMPLAQLHDARNGFLVKDTCIIAAEVYAPKSEHENQGDEVASLAASLKSEGQAGQMEVKTLQSEDHVELMDFRGLGQIEKDYVPLLEEVSSQHPSLIECQQKRSRRFIEWAFTALGRVLHFLKTKRLKDMNDDTCKDLQILWEELETFRFDLTWLEPHVQSALGMKIYMERAMQVQKQKENVVAQELEINRLKAKLAAAEVDLDIARQELLKAAEGFEERDVDAELGYGRP